MKNFTKTTQILFFLITFLSFSVSSQAKKAYEGYVITNSGEKLEGKIQMLSPTLNEVKVKFVATSGKKTVFKAKEVKEYSFKVQKWNKVERKHIDEWIVYTRKSVERSPIAFGPKEVLIERQVAGKINMYNHFIEQNSNRQSPFVRIIYVEKNADKLVSITKSNYKKVLKEMTNEYPELQAKIGTRGHGFKHISKIISTYNTWMTNNGNEVILGMK